MTSVGCVFVAAAIIWYNYLVVVKGEKYAKEPRLSSALVTLALMDLIYDIGLFEKKKEDVPKFVKWILEVAVSVFLLDVGLNIWRAIDLIMCLFVRFFVEMTGLVSSQTYNEYEYYCDACISIPLAYIILAYAGYATDHFHILNKKLLGIKPKNVIEAEMNELLDIDVIDNTDEMEETPEPPQPRNRREKPKLKAQKLK
ncbi:hypothetical protein KR074_011302 [Drosophila pseudoananassae]|nr:hypothetical protein KR074_011302 [Drosophila pseudoananassae]